MFVYFFRCIADLSELGVPVVEMQRLVASFSTVLKVTCIDDFEQQVSDKGQLYGFGADPALFESKRAATGVRPTVPLPDTTPEDQRRLDSLKRKAKEQQEAEQAAEQAAAAATTTGGGGEQKQVEKEPEPSSEQKVAKKESSKAGEGKQTASHSSFKASSGTKQHKAANDEDEDSPDPESRHSSASTKAEMTMSEVDEEQHETKELPVQIPSDAKVYKQEKGGCCIVQ